MEALLVVKRASPASTRLVWEPPISRADSACPASCCEVRARVSQANLEELAVYGERVLSAASLDEVLR